MKINFKIKICGITNPQDALMAIAAGADAIGINFYAKSLRHVIKTDARIIVDAIREVNSYVCSVGVFVNEKADRIKAIIEATGIEIVQLHGDEAPEILRDLPDVPCIRAFRCSKRTNEEIQSDIAPWLDAGIDSILLDSGSETEYGGSGISLDFEQISKILPRGHWILAGGLTPENIKTAIRKARPMAVDVASGIEGFPGKKDQNKTEAFIANALEGFNSKNR